MDLIEKAREWIGTEWHHNQRQKGIAVDCVNFLSEVAKESGLEIEEIPEEYGRVATENKIELYLDRNFLKKSSDIIERNDIILYSFFGLNNHVAIASSETTIIHASQKEGRVVEHTIDGIWLKRIKGVWRVKWERF